jgi:cytochrome P450 PksS
VNLIGGGTLALLQNPNQLRLLRAQPALINSAVEELLRFTSPVETASERYATAEMSMRSQIIHKGDLVLAAIASANRDELVFAKADQLDITRDKNRHLAFGLGSHFCLGAPLARMEGQIAMNLLVQRLPHMKLAVPAEKLRWRATPIVRGLEALPLNL